MIKNNKTKTLISSLIILLPTLFGIIIWDKLPNDMVSHIGLDGTADALSPKAFCVFGMPVILLALHLFCLWITGKDPKNKKQTKKAIGMVYWIIPAISIYTSLLFYSIASGMDISYEVITLMLIGIMFVAIGNYLPKCKQNYTLGIKVKWAIENEENWNATHRFGGKVWVVCGAVIMLCAFLPGKFIPYVLIGSLLPTAIIPTLYSYLYYKRQTKKGTYAVTQTAPTMPKVYKIITVVCIAAIVIFVPLISNTGDIDFVFGEDALAIEADYYNDISVSYESIDDIEFYEAAVEGLRTNGFGSFRLLMGQFKNDEFGYYTRYTYYKDAGSVVLSIGTEKLVIGGKTLTETKVLYDTLKEKIK
ncbi:MAG: SdpI family protein [Clostridia bacterium]|nr:SdpI family protein [Clostridia bacterium]